MAKSTLKLSGAYPAWGSGVRTGKLVRANGQETPVLLRVETADATTERLAERREEARLLARASNAGLLRLEQIVPVGGKVARVYEACDGASLPRIREVATGRGETVPPRVALGIAAAVGHALDASLGLREGDRAIAAPGSLWEDVLVEPGGRVRLARLDTAPADAPRAAEAARAVALLAVETLTGPAPGTSAPDLEVALARVASLGGNGELGRTLAEVLLLGQSTTPAALARTFERLAAAHPGPTLAAWAPGTVSAALRVAIGGGAPLPDTATGAVPRAQRPARTILPAPSPGLPLPEASRPYDRSRPGRPDRSGPQARVQTEELDVDAPTTVFRSRKSASLDALVNDVDESEATVVGIARMPDPLPGSERDPFELTGSMRPPTSVASPGDPPRRAHADALSPLEAPAGGNGKPGRLLPILAVSAALLLVGAAVALGMRGGEEAPASAAVETPAGSGEAPAPPPVALQQATPMPEASPPAPELPRPRAKAERAERSAREPAPEAAPVSRSATTAASVPAPVAAPSAAPATGSGASTHRVVFASGNGKDLEVECVDGRGRGGTVTIPATPSGPCRVKGRDADGNPLTTNKVVSASGSFTCFAGGAKDCR